MLWDVTKVAITIRVIGLTSVRCKQFNFYIVPIAHPLQLPPHFTGSGRLHEQTTHVNNYSFVRRGDSSTSTYY